MEWRNDDAMERPMPSYRGLFRFYEHSDLVVLVPALIASIVSGILVPAFTILLGKMFSAFGDFSSGKLDGEGLRSQIASYVVGVCIVGLAAWVLGWLNMSLWLTFGENTAKKARQEVLKGLMLKNMAWFDAHGAKGGLSGNMNKAVKYLFYVSSGSP
jgi:ATP-binding cassette subfamily B (MDR/TAP) protein 1